MARSFHILSKVLNISAERYLRSAGDLFIYEGDYESALLLVDKSLEISPEDVRALGLKGDILYCLNRDLEALDIFNRALTLEPTCIEVLLSKSCTLDVLEKRREALHFCNTALALALPESHCLLGNIYEQKLSLLLELRRHYEAKQTLKEALRHLPESDYLPLKAAYQAIIDQRCRERLPQLDKSRLRIVP